MTGFAVNPVSTRRVVDIVDGKESPTPVRAVTGTGGSPDVLSPIPFGSPS